MRFRFIALPILVAIGMIIFDLYSYLHTSTIPLTFWPALAFLGGLHICLEQIDDIIGGDRDWVGTLVTMLIGTGLMGWGGKDLAPAIPVPGLTHWWKNAEMVLWACLLVWTVWLWYKNAANKDKKAQGASLALISISIQGKKMEFRIPSSAADKEADSLDDDDDVDDDVDGTIDRPELLDGDISFAAENVDYVLDLSNTRVTPGPHVVRVSVNVGDVRIVIPDNISYSIMAKVPVAGRVTVFGESVTNTFDVNCTRKHDVEGAHAQIHFYVQVTNGDLAIEKADVPLLDQPA